jgi:hypothetical protein
MAVENFHRFSRWTPDLTPLVGGSLVCENTLPVDDGFVQMPQPMTIGPSGCPGVPYQLLVARNSIGERLALCLTSAGIYRILENAWSPLDGAANIPSESWRYQLWGDALYCVNGRDPLKKSDLTALGAVSSVATPNNLTGTDVATVADFLVLIDVREEMESVRWPYRAQWSGIFRPEIFTPDPAIQSDFQDVADIGELRRIMGGEYGLVLGANGTSRMDYVGSDIGFTFSTIETEVGCELANTAVRVGDRTIWWSSRGWRGSSGGPSEPIGAGICDRWFSAVVNRKLGNRITTLVLPTVEVIIWSFASRFSIDGEPDLALAYHWRLGLWTPGRFSCSALGNSTKGTATTDDFVVDLLNFDHDTSRTDDYRLLTDTIGNTGEFPAAMLNGTLCNMINVSDVTIKLQTEEIEFIHGRRTNLQRFLPIVEGAAAMRASVLARDSQSQGVLDSVINLQEDIDGKFTPYLKGRYHRIELEIVTPFTKATGIDPTDFVQTGRRS